MPHRERENREKTEKIFGTNIQPCKLDSAECFFFVITNIFKYKRTLQIIGKNLETWGQAVEIWGGLIDQNQLDVLVEIWGGLIDRNQSDVLEE